MNRAASAAVGLALLAAIGGAQRLIPDADLTYRPIATGGVVGEEVRVLPYTFRVDGVDVGRTLRLEKSYGGKTMTTGGVWVVVRAGAAATTEQVTLGTAVLRSADGAEFAVSDRVLGLEGEPLQAGIWRSGTLAFEILPAQVEGARLVISKARYSSIHRLNGALGPAVEIDLGLTRERLAAAGPTVTIKEGAP